MSRHGVIKLQGQAEEDRVMKIYCLLKTYDIAKKKKGFDLFKFITTFLNTP